MSAPSPLHVLLETLAELSGTVQRKTIDVELPDGTGSVKKTIPNPLFTYAFHPTPGKTLFVSQETQALYYPLTHVGKIAMDPLAKDTPLSD